MKTASVILVMNLALIVLSCLVDAWLFLTGRTTISTVVVDLTRAYPWIPLVYGAFFAGLAAHWWFGYGNQGQREK